MLHNGNGDQEPMASAVSRFAFFLGGQDLEMVTIRDLLQEEGCEYVDRGLGWGAAAIEYRAQIEEAVKAGLKPVLVELGEVEALGDLAGEVIAVDHHGDNAGVDRPTSLEQVFALLRLPQDQWTRWHALVAANDRGHVRAMQALGATPEEIVQVRREDRAAQGVTQEQEESGAQAVQGLREVADGKLSVVQLPHAKTSVVADRLEPALGGRGYENLLVICPDEVNFFGEGRWIEWLGDRFPGGWSGGELPRRGFWGHPGQIPGLQEELAEAMRNS